MFDPEEDVPIYKISNYYLSGKGLLSGRGEIAQQALLLWVSLSGASLYFMPAYALASSKYASILAGTTPLWRILNYIPSTCTSGMTVLYIATDSFFNTWRNETVPDELNGFLVPPAGNRNLQAAIIFTGAAASAVPLSIVSFAYPLPVNSFALQVVQGIIIEIDNTVLHFLPLKLAMQYKIYRLPLLPFEMIYQACYPEKSPVYNAEAENLRATMIEFLQYVRRSIVLDKCRVGFYCYEWEKSFKKNFLSEISDNTIAKDFLGLLAKEFSFTSANIKFPRSAIHDGIGMFLGAASGVWVASSCIGYFFSSDKQLLMWMRNPILAGAIAALPYYFLTVLLTYIGYFAGKDLYDYLTSWGKDDIKLPLEFKLFPKTYTLLMILNVYMMFYGYAAAEQLVHDNFNGKEWEDVKPVLVWLARTGIGFLGLSANKDFIQTILRKFAMYRGGEEACPIARLMTSLEQLEGAIRTAESKALIQSKPYMEKIGIVQKFEISEDSFLVNEDESPGLIKKQKYGWTDWIKNKYCSCWQQAEEIEEAYPQVNYQKQTIDLSLN